MIDWTPKNAHGGYRSADNTVYIQQSPKRFYSVSIRTEDGWTKGVGGFRSVEDAKAHAEEMVR